VVEVADNRTFVNRCYARRWMATVMRPTSTPYSVKLGNLTNQRLEQATDDRKAIDAGHSNGSERR